MAHGHGHKHGHGHDHGHGHQQHGNGMAQMLDLDAEVLRDYYSEVIGWAGSLVPDSPHIIDLGAGTGTGTIALARHLPAASLTAVDMDEEMLAHLRRRVAEAGFGDRVGTVRADLDDEFPELRPADLVWASASMHHLADPARTLARVRDVLRPGGVFMITELEGFPRFLTETAGAALEERCHAELARLRLEAGMHMGEDWGARLKAAGFEVEGERHFDIELRQPLPPQAARYAQVTLQRTRERLADRLSADDLAALTTYTENLDGREDLTVRATRDVWIGRRR
ncbi:class I SAM-dependent methyltransferase [Actinoplanes regularis]|uniref:Methyltransferase domain-containing protein n=1 Tax=Actinoplanes regularis TaxID=52697 RepID=A0A239CXP8_9ACTN|nr:class I SAM-dependent methyltransferase [Actinoplanes regularis]GIE88512.1 SAM-dependent methyltransferase [Actinoplanes regularis]SNS24880.1 Methyltransferase domain-containing protein [Actinoplanes regularis]